MSGTSITQLIKEFKEYADEILSSRKRATEFVNIIWDKINNKEL